MALLSLTDDLCSHRPSTALTLRRRFQSHPSCFHAVLNFASTFSDSEYRLCDVFSDPRFQLEARELYSRVRKVSRVLTLYP